MLIVRPPLLTRPECFLCSRNAGLGACLDTPGNMASVGCMNPVVERAHLARKGDGDVDPDGSDEKMWADNVLPDRAGARVRPAESNRADSMQSVGMRSVHGEASAQMAVDARVQPVESTRADSVQGVGMGIGHGEGSAQMTADDG